MKLSAQYIVDAKGRRRAVQLSLRAFHKLVSMAEDFEDIAYLKTHRSGKLIPMSKVHASLK